MKVTAKKRIQVQIDRSLAEQTEQVLKTLGLTSTTAINLFFKRIVAQGGLPFALTEREQNTLALLAMTKGLPAKKLDTTAKVNEWLNAKD
ncbi:type II toxin-antitoxin system RelB/DinJ family antitoxin [Loigolactobacillus binensis]|uniref:Type II toxin-antitoxin system RelB/DinJ family antitoxin n=1 Tax=Loigolactobacillus binensis TaxID=2559922 RepID=A0ABW3EF65_9LACO|nr:type II toxin-antitoxin system RelB/DinJ family antitoxin [Loigolactobacillus binensis]